MGTTETASDYLAKNAEIILERLKQVVPGSLAEYLDVTRQAISRAKHSKVPMDWVVAVALDLQISMDWLIRGTGPRDDFERLSLTAFPWVQQAAKLPEHSLERARYVFEQGCKDAKFPGSFFGNGENEPAIKKYLNKGLDDSQLYYQARDWAKDKIRMIKESS